MIAKKIFYFLLFLCFPLKLYSQEDTISLLGQEKIGLASYYHMPGMRTASGEMMKHGGFTCAHPSYPFGTMLQVINLANKKSVIVRVTDRGPFSGKRILDLSLEPARAIGMLHTGTAKVRATVVGEGGEVFLLPSEEIPMIDYSFKTSIPKKSFPLLPNKKEQLKTAKKKSANAKKVKTKRKNRRK